MALWMRCNLQIGARSHTLDILSLFLHQPYLYVWHCVKSTFFPHILPFNITRWGRSDKAICLSRVLCYSLWSTISNDNRPTITIYGDRKTAALLDSKCHDINRPTHRMTKSMQKLSVKTRQLWFQLYLFDEWTQINCWKRCLLSRFQNHGTSSCHGRGHFVDGKEKREIPLHSNNKPSIVSSVITSIFYRLHLWRGFYFHCRLPVFLSMDRMILKGMRRF